MYISCICLYQSPILWVANANHWSIMLPCLYTAACRQGEFRCPRDNRCVPANRRCDGRRDCRDGSDERGCPCESNWGLCWVTMSHYDHLSSHMSSSEQLWAASSNSLLYKIWIAQLSLSICWIFSLNVYICSIQLSFNLDIIWSATKHFETHKLQLGLSKICELEFYYIWLRNITLSCYISTLCEFTA